MFVFAQFVAALLRFCSVALFFGGSTLEPQKRRKKGAGIVGPRNFNWSATGGRVLMLKKDNKPRTLLQQSGEVVTNSELQWKKEKTEKQWDSSQLDVAVTFHAFYWAFSDPFFIIPDRARAEFSEAGQQRKVWGESHALNLMPSQCPENEACQWLWVTKLLCQAIRFLASLWLPHTQLDGQLSVLRSRFRGYPYAPSHAQQLIDG